MKSVTGEGQEAVVGVLYPDGTQMTYLSRYLLRHEETAGNLEGLGGLSGLLSGNLGNALGDHSAMFKRFLRSKLQSSGKSSSSSSDDNDDDN